MKLALAAAVLLALAPTAPLAAQDSRTEWNRPAEPFRIVGNVYYVGTDGLSAYLVTGPEGHVLIDGGSEESAPQIAESIAKLGFRVEDVKAILINHAHWDHAGGLAELKRLSGARLYASAGGKPELEGGRTPDRPELDPFAAVDVDQVVTDGETLTVGDLALTAHLTPGHTRGSTSWSLRTEESGKPLDVLFASSFTVAGQKLVNEPAYPDAAGDFRSTFAKLRETKADVFLNFHPASSDIAGKRARLAAGDAFAFVDPGELRRQVDAAEKGFENELKRQQADAAR